MLSQDGDTVVVFNGEIYNHLELRRELIQRGRRFQSQCDTETLLASVSRMGHRRVPAAARDVRGGVLEPIPATAGAGARPDGDQAAIRLREARRVVFRLRGQDHPEASGAESLDRRRGSASLSLDELRSRARDAGRGDRETPARALDGMEQGARFGAGVLEAGVRARPSHHATGRQAGTGPAAARIRSRASRFRRSLGSVVQRRTRFLDHGPLRSREDAWTVEDVFRILPWTQVRRKPVFPVDRGVLWDRSSRVRSDSRRRSCGRDSGVRRIFRRAQRRCGRAAGVVPFQDDPAGSNGGAFRRRRRRVVRRLLHLPGQSLCAQACACCRCGCAAGPAARPG